MSQTYTTSQQNVNPENIGTPKTFTIEGNIGCGKSTFLKIVRKHFPQLQLIDQPVDQWQNLAGKGFNVLDRYYKDSKRWGLTFLNYATFTRVRRFMNTLNGRSQGEIISERSILSDKHVFGPLMADLGFIDQAEYEIFLEMYKGYQQIMGGSMPKVIYLQCSPEKCNERTQKRHRSQEESIPIDYFRRLHQKHQAWMRQESPSQMLVINTTQEFQDEGDRIQEMVSKLSAFIYPKGVVGSQDTQ